MNKKAILLVGVLGSMLSGAAAAAHNLSYSYAQVDYRDYDAETGFGEAGASGFGVSGSFEIGPTAFVVAEYAAISGDFDYLGFNFDFDSTDIKLGLGGAWAISDMADFYGIASFVSNDIEVSGGGTSGSDDDSGYELTGGVRAMVSDKFELYGEMNYLDIYDGSDTGFEFGGRFAINPSFGVVFAYETADDVDGFKIGARFEF